MKNNIRLYTVIVIINGGKRRFSDNKYYSLILGEW